MPACLRSTTGRWPELRERIASVLATRTRDEWAAVFETTDCCVAPVLTFDEARVYGHHLDRGTFVDDTELAVIPRLLEHPANSRAGRRRGPGSTPTRSCSQPDGARMRSPRCAPTV